MRRTILILGAFFALSSPAWGREFCTTRGRYTYCDNGDAWYKTKSGGIVPWGLKNSDKPSYSKYGNSLSGTDGSVRTKRNGKVTSSHRTRPSSRDVVIDEIFGGDDW